MIPSYVFYKKLNKDNVVDEVMAESAVFNNVLNQTVIKSIYKTLNEKRLLLQRTTLTDFRNYLSSSETDLFEEISITCKKDGKTTTRLVTRHKEVSPYAIALSLAPHTYASHYSALYLQNLTLNIPKPIYVKKKATRPKAMPEPEKLSQAQLEKTFAVPAKTTNSIYTFRYKGVTREVYLLEKSATVDNGITRISAPHAPAGIAISGVEKTLIECVLKPNYAGGAQEVLNAFYAAKDRLKILRMMQLLEEGRYSLPYGKNILFYMDRAGYSERQKDLVRQRMSPATQELITYLEKNMHNPALDANIGIYYPERIAVQ
ncbi:hypothetical protein GA0061078_1595 [Bifidobacterium bohemicum]|uniref:Uncharacterized protein n=1 Tax=Bifidobacterium bohemicum DSM 22767 TaxID=1437606 RepID=A0A086ZHF7_9BIFI|nr:hypothetical protein [Bifidobacterium bohemicum]KFI45957.1 hypothetical protein BBOH_0764 [Bifidobacterium bohemicum DSM 22767]SCC14147.1 hypothetical protein GA0061078_1595 [Bifidobacterium bohemicum]